MIDFTYLNLKEYTLFLDRDGVINRRMMGGYITDPYDFDFMHGALDAIKIFTKKFKRIIVVTNQQGIGKGLMTEKELKKVHDFMLSEIEKNKGKIAKIYHAPQLASEESEMRKPNPGMALQAQKDFGDIDFKKCFMVGDMPSDMEFGRKLGMNTVYIHATSTLNEEEKNNTDLVYPALLSFANQIKR